MSNLGLQLIGIKIVFRDLSPEVVVVWTLASEFF
jgi:hypothetical protein